MKRRVAIIVPGGIGKEQHIPALLQLVSRLSAAYTLHIHSFSPEELHPSLVRQGVVSTMLPSWIRGRRLPAMICVFFELLKSRRTHPPCLIHAFWVFPAGLTALAAGLFLKCPVVLTLPGGDTVHLPEIRYGGMKSPLHRALVRWCCRRADRVVFLTRFQEERARAQGIHPEHGRIVPYGVDTDEFSFQPRALSTPLQLISIGSINRVKEVALQIRTLAHLLQQVDCRLTVVGPDLMDGAIRRLAESLHVSHAVDFRGECSHSELPSLLYASHMLIHTAWYDAEGVVIMEAFAAGTVAIGTRVGLLAEVDTAHEFTVDRYDPALLAELILRIVRDPKQYRTFQERNRRFAERFSGDWTKREYAKLYDEAGETAGKQ